MKKTKSRPDLVLDEEHGRKVIDGLYGAYVSQRQLFSLVNRETHAPQRRFIPKGMEPGGLKHRRWLFFAAMTDRREESERVYESHVRLAATVPRLYTEAVVRMRVGAIAEILSTVKIGSPMQSARYWPRSARTLFAEYSGDPLLIYQHGDGLIDDVLRTKRSREGDRLPGFGPKILSLLALFYEELGRMAMPRDAFPVDVHVQRFLISTGILKGVGIATNEEVERIARPFLCRICQLDGIPALELSHAIWFLGNRVCRSCCRNNAALALCPAYRQCGGAISTFPYTRKGIWEFDASRHRKGGAIQFLLPADGLLFREEG